MSSSTAMTRSAPERFILPDLVTDCHFPLRGNVHCDAFAHDSVQWLLNGSKNTERRARAFMGLKANELTAFCYPDADAYHFRVSVDYMNYLFNLDDWLDEFKVDDLYALRDTCLDAMRDPHNYVSDKRVVRMTKSIFSRMDSTASAGCKQRFIESMDLFFLAVVQQTLDRDDDVIPDLESYIGHRRDTSGCRPCFVLIEYANQLNIPDEVMAHPSIKAMEDASNDFVSWSNDMFSYNVEQSRNETHNMIPVLMNEHALSLQEAVDYIGDFCRQCIKRFEDEREALPSWGPEIDADVMKYVDGLQNWIVGSLHWSFSSKRYFGEDGPMIKKHCYVELLPKVSKNQN